MNKFVDLSSRKIESISRISLPNSTKVDFLFFLGGGDVGYWRFSVGKEGGGGGKETSKERFLGKIDLHVFPHFCPMNYSALYILMVLKLKLSQAKTSSNPLVSQ